MAAEAPTRSRRRGRLLVLVGFAGVVALAVLFAVPLLSGPTSDAEARFSDALGAPATVSVGERVVVEAVDVPLEGTTALLSRLRLDMDGLHGGGTFAAELDDDAVQLLVGTVGRLPLTDVELRGGFARLVFAGMPVVDATVELEDGTVVFRPRTPIVGERLGVSLRLDGLPLGLEPSEARIRRRLLVLTGPVPRPVLPPG